MNHIKSYVKDSTNFLRRIFSLNDKLPENIILLTIDVKSLYTNIPNDEGIKASMEVLEKLFLLKSKKTALARSKDGMSAFTKVK